MSSSFVTSLFSIVVIDLLLAGDNAVVIAMAVRPLPQEQRRLGIALGALAAVVVRVVLTFFLAQLLLQSFVKLVGGLLVLWIAVKLFSVDRPPERTRRGAKGTLNAVQLIVVADVTMSLDNMLAVGGASRGNLVLLVLGLGFSIPCVVLASDLLARLMDRHPLILYLGAAVLGKVAAEMILTDPFTKGWLHPSPILLHSAEGVLALGVVLCGRYCSRRTGARPSDSPA
ncbi:MAG TPA: TerC family protein [Anaeromyxobacteraceae bacterium]|nr:TerC family protein [Anaeromyxobacteraceae bacterium]